MALVDGCNDERLDIEDGWRGSREGRNSGIMPYTKWGEFTQNGVTVRVFVDSDYSAPGTSGAPYVTPQGLADLRAGVADTLGSNAALAAEIQSTLGGLTIYITPLDPVPLTLGSPAPAWPIPFGYGWLLPGKDGYGIGGTPSIAIRATALQDRGAELVVHEIAHKDLGLKAASRLTSLVPDGETLAILVENYFGYGPSPIRADNGRWGTGRLRRLGFRVTGVVFARRLSDNIQPAS